MLACQGAYYPTCYNVDLQAASIDTHLACMHCHKVRTDAMSPTAMTSDYLRISYKCDDHCNAATRIKL